MVGTADESREELSIGSRHTHLEMGRTSKVGNNSPQKTSLPKKHQSSGRSPRPG